MQFLSRYAGASSSALGALLVLVGVLLPTYASGDYEPYILHSTTPWLLFALIVAPALLVLGISLAACFHTLPSGLVVLCLLIIMLAFLLHLLAPEVARAYVCQGGYAPCVVHPGTGFWLPLVGFPLSMVGLAVLAATQHRRS